MGFLGLVAIFKNEATIMEEWLAHYFAEGVDVIHLIDNGSTDQYLDKLRNFIDAGRVQLVIDRTRHMQKELYNKHYGRICRQNFKWVMIVDLDEFMYARMGFATIRQYLMSLPCHVKQVYVPWKMFGSNGNITQPPSVVYGFTRRKNISRPRKQNDRFLNPYFVKSIVRASWSQPVYQELFIHASPIRFRGYICLRNVLRKLNLLTLLTIIEGFFVFLLSTCYKGCEITSDGRQITYSQDGMPHYPLHNAKQFLSEKALSDSALHINHYVIQSLDWYRGIKMTRGDVDFHSLEELRDMTYFNCVDKECNDQDDTELRDKCAKLL